MSSDLRIAKDTYVQFTYQITSRSGEVIERIDLPLTTILGRHNRLYDKIEMAMIGAAKGDDVTVELAPKECAWGESDPGLIFEDAISNVPPEHRKVGAEVQFQNDKGELKTFRVTKVTDNTVTIDGNHPFAGQPVNFHVKILEVRKATGEELVEGVASGAEAIGGIPTPTPSGKLH
jgi:FKBP-type peptidyl-prolyl cis-trans isomerase SlyD